MKKKQVENNKRISLLIILIVSIIILGWILTLILLKDMENRGTFGDMFGSINAIYSGLALAGIIITILLQKNELKLQREELKETREEFKIQNETLKYQQFENTFFSLLNLHHRIVDGIDFRKLKDNSLHAKIYTNEDDENITLQGRDVFSHLYSDLREDLKYSNVEINQTYMRHYSNYQSDFGHYFRNLYRIIKLVDTTDFNFNNTNLTEDFSIKYKYVSIVRAQISDYELLWLFYNCLCENGYERFKPLVEKYTFFKNIPIDKLANEDHTKLYKKVAIKKPGVNKL